MFPSDGRNWQRRETFRLGDAARRLALVRFSDARHIASERTVNASWSICRTSATSASAAIAAGDHLHYQMGGSKNPFPDLLYRCRQCGTKAILLNKVCRRLRPRHQSLLQTHHRRASFNYAVDSRIRTAASLEDVHAAGSRSSAQRSVRPVVGQAQWIDR